MTVDATAGAERSAKDAWSIPLWLLLTTGGLLLAGGYVVDDAFVVFRVAERLARGEGWSFQGSASADGVTAPLWGALLALLVPGGSTPLVARLLGSLFTLAGGTLTLAALRGQPRTLAALFLGAQLPVVVWAGAGLETGFVLLVVALCTRGLLAHRSREAARPAPDAAVESHAGPWESLCRALTLGAFASVPWLRPELVPLAAMAGWELMRMERRERGARLAPLLVLGVGTLLVIVWRVVAFGHPAPLAALAKPSDPLNGLLYVGQGLLASGALTALAIAAIARLRARAQRTDQPLEAAPLTDDDHPHDPQQERGGRAPIRVLGVGLLSIALAGGDWMPASRLLVPLLPLLAGCVGLGLAELPRFRWAAVLAVLLLPLATGAAALPELLRQPAARERGAAQVLAALHGAERVALVDIGYLAYAGDLQVVDLGGITDLEIARLPGGHLSKRIPESLLRGRGVDAIVLHSTTPPRVEAGRLMGISAYPVELHVARMPFVRDEFRVTASVTYAPDYHYVVLRRSPP
ncbi:MAG: hypothetical protein IPG81_17965 [Sandaracinaceae bacterium]|nr:hypothetical protein [Sandaracinaceae bacterium]